MKIKHNLLSYALTPGGERLADLWRASCSDDQRHPSFRTLLDVAAGRCPTRGHVNHCSLCTAMVQLLEIHRASRRAAERVVLSQLEDARLQQGNVTYVFRHEWSRTTLGDLYVRRLLPQEASHPSIGALMSEWSKRGLPRELPLALRAGTDLILLAYAIEDGAEVPVGILVGRPSARELPTYDELFRGVVPRAGEPVASFVCYQVIVRDDWRGYGIGLRLLLEACQIAKSLYGDSVVIRTMSPLPGLMSFVGWLGGCPNLPVPYGKGTMGELLRDVSRARVWAEVLAVAGDLSPLRLQVAEGDLQAWLRRIAGDPRRLRNDLLADAASSGAVKRLLGAIAQQYATSTWELSDGGRAKLVCWVAHFHLRQGSADTVFLIGGRLNDLASGCSSVSFTYVAESLAEHARTFEDVRRAKQAQMQQQKMRACM